jgi:hypothetical protein
MAPILGIFASQISGHLWAPSGAYDSIATVTVGSGGSSSISFTSIPSTYTHLQLRINGRDNRGVYRDFFAINFNGDTGNNYAGHSLGGNGSSASAGGYSTFNEIQCGWVAGASANNANGFGVSVTDILDYTNTNKNTTVRGLGGYDDNGQGDIQLFSGLWMNTAAITQISVTPGSGTSFSEYSSFALYGIKGN